jgi:toxin-antitoxin system PIN domain toxin
MSWLLDVNVLVALLYDRHEFHDRASIWFANVGQLNWLSCPITENGAIRVLGGARFPDRLEVPEIARQLRALMSLTSHRFLVDEASLLDESLVDFSKISGSKQATDTYLVALAAQNDVVMATLDERIDPSPVTDGARHLMVIPRDVTLT